eukprot:4342463-Prymnesium_polylepis.1
MLCAIVAAASLLPGLGSPVVGRAAAPPCRHVAPCAMADAAPDAAARAALERMLQIGEEPPAAPELELESGVLHDLPLWRVQWSVVPGHNQLLHVHVPHYTDMVRNEHIGARVAHTHTHCAPPWPASQFSRIQQQPDEGTRLFGHLLLPGGSANLGEPRYALGVPGSEAPTVG